MVYEYGILDVCVLVWFGEQVVFYLFVCYPESEFWGQNGGEFEDVIVRNL